MLTNPKIFGPAVIKRQLSVSLTLHSSMTTFADGTMIRLFLVLNPDTVEGLNLLHAPTS